MSNNKNILKFPKANHVSSTGLSIPPTILRLLDIADISLDEYLHKCLRTMALSDPEIPTISMGALILSQAKVMDVLPQSYDEENLVMEIDDFISKHIKIRQDQNKLSKISDDFWGAYLAKRMITHIKYLRANRPTHPSQDS